MVKQVVNRTDDSHLGRALRKIIMRKKKNEIGCRDFASTLQTRLALNSLTGDLLVSAFLSAELKGMSQSLAKEF